MSIQNDHQVSHSQAEDTWADHGSDFLLVTEGKPPPRIELAHERLHLPPVPRSVTNHSDDYGAEFCIT